MRPVSVPGTAEAAGEGTARSGPVTMRPPPNALTIGKLMAKPRSGRDDQAGRDRRRGAPDRLCDAGSGGRGERGRPGRTPRRAGVLPDPALPYRPEPAAADR